MAFPDGWTKQKIITLTGSVDDSLEDYQTEDVEVLWESPMRSDFGDIRFTEDDLVTEIPYKLVSYVSESGAVFRLKPSEIPISPGTLDVVMWFGKSDATTTSQSDATFYEWIDDCTGTFADKWNIIHAGGGSQGYDTVAGETAIKISNSGDYCLIASKDLSLSNPFKLEFDMYLADYIGLVHYGLPATPTGESDDYRARFDSRYGYDELLDANGVQFGSAGDLSLIQYQWYPCSLTVDQTNFHVWRIDGWIGGNGEDDTYTSGHIGFESTWNGYIGIKAIKVSKYTENPPVWGEWGETLDVLEKSRFRAKLQIVDEVIKRFRSKLWIEPERTRFRATLQIYELVKTDFRVKLKTIELNPKLTQVRDRFRAQIETIETERTRFRAKIRTNTRETRVELYANVVLKRSEFDVTNPEFEFSIGGERYDS